MWVATQDLPRSAAHPFYMRLNQILDKHEFDSYVEGVCQRFYADDIGRPGLPPGRYFRMLLIGYFEGIDSERGIAWRVADSIALREFLGLVLPRGDAGPFDDVAHAPADRRGDAQGGVPGSCSAGRRGLGAGQTVGIDATMLEANAALRSIVRRDTGEAIRNT